MTLALPRMLVLAPLLLMGAPLASRADDAPPTAGILQRLIEQSGVHGTSKTGTTPNFVVDPAWPQIAAPFAGCWARSAVSMSTATTMSGSITGRAP